MAEKTRVNSHTLKWLYSVLGKKRNYIVILTLLQGMGGAAGVLYALLLRNIVDAAVTHNSVDFWRWMTSILILAGIQLALNTMIRWMAELSRATFENLFKTRLTDVLLHRDYLQVSAIHSAEWLNRLTSDTVVVADNCVDIIPGLSGMIVQLVCAVGMILILEPKLAFILIPSGFLLLFFTGLFRRVLKRLHKGIREADGRLRVFLQERISSMLVIRSYAAEAQTEVQAQEKMEKHKDARMRRNRFSNLCNIGFGTAMRGMTLLGVGWCGYGILIGTVSFGTLTAVIQLVSQIQTPFANITGYLPKYYSMLASAERLMEAERFTQEQEGAISVSIMQEFYHTKLAAIGLQDSSFTYFPVVERINDLSKLGMPAVLRHINLEVRKGEYVAFTGPSGCGKSTVLKMLMCVYRLDSGWRYYIDTDNRQNELTPAFRRLFAYVPQGNVLMNGSIREVIAFAEPEAAGDNARIQRALEIVCAEDFVGELESGVDTLLGEHGAGLSEGQMQRIAIARAVFSEAPILLLDEVTSSLDSETECRLLNNLRSMTDKTVVIVTHRPAALTICDRVLQFTEDGIIEV